MDFEATRKRLRITCCRCTSKHVYQEDFEFEAFESDVFEPEGFKFEAFEPEDLESEGFRGRRRFLVRCIRDAFETEAYKTEAFQIRSFRQSSREIERFETSFVTLNLDTL